MTDNTKGEAELPPPHFMVEKMRPRVSGLASKLAKEYGYLPYMIERYLRFLGEDETISFLKAVEKGLPKSIRCNTLVLKDCKKLPKLLKRHGIVIEEHEVLPHAYLVKKGGDKIGHTTEYMLGMYYIQGLASMLAPLILSPKPTNVVADLAAAPGGKTTYLAQIMENNGIILSVDENPHRIKALLSNVQRMHVTNTIILKSSIEDLPASLDGMFDKVLLDAPCTAEGLLPIKRERKTSTTYEEIVKACRVQYTVLERSLELLKPGGHLLYVTCSIAPEENEVVLSSIIGKRSDLEIIETRWGNIGRPGIVRYGNYNLSKEMKKCLRVYPHTDNMEGFFYCLIRKKK